LVIKDSKVIMVIIPSLPRRTASLLLLIAAAFSFSWAEDPVHAVGAVRPGFDSSALTRDDDISSPAVPIGFTVNFFGAIFDTLYVNNNGNVTFDASLTAFTPFSLTNTGRQIIAPFFADVDTRGPGAQAVTYGPGTAYGLPAFGVNWINVGYYQQKSDKLNSFQLIIIDRSDINPGDFDFEFNYDWIQWEAGDASGGTDGIGGDTARAGYSNGTGQAGTAFELPGSAIDGAFLDSSLATGLANTSYRSPVVGRHLFSIRNGSNATPPVDLNEPVGATVTLPDRDCSWTSNSAGQAFIVGISGDPVPGGAVRCHVLNRNGLYVENPGQIGVQSLIDLGVMQAVDIYGIMPDGRSVVPFQSPVYACLRGTDQVVFLSAADQPRYPIGVPTFPNGDYTCTTLYSSGTVVMVDND
jgi:hypothetical protein